MNQALSAALGAESDAFKARLARAENALGAADPQAEPEPAPPEAIKPTERVPTERVVREAFTIPEAEHPKIAEVRQRMLGVGVHVTKSEVMRAGLLLLAETDAAALGEVFERVEKIKTGRPKTV